MSERVFRFVVGFWLLVALYIDAPALIYALITLLLLEGISNRRVPMIVSRLRGMAVADGDVVNIPCRIPFEAERALRLVVAATLVLTFVLFGQTLWFFPWFTGFVLIGAGLSGVCPMVMALRALGFR